MAGAKRSRSCGPDLAPGVIPSSMPLLDLQLRITLPDCFHRSNIVVDLDRVRRALLRIAAISMSSSARSVEDLEHAQIDPDVRAERRRRLAESPLALPAHGAFCSRYYPDPVPAPPAAVFPHARRCSTLGVEQGRVTERVLELVSHGRVLGDSDASRDEPPADPRRRAERLGLLVTWCHVPNGTPIPTSPLVTASLPAPQVR